MKAQIEKISAQLSKMVERAEELADSENPDTADRYEQVVENLNAAIEALQEAVMAW